MARTKKSRSRKTRKARLPKVKKSLKRTLKRKKKSPLGKPPPLLYGDDSDVEIIED